MNNTAANPIALDHLGVLAVRGPDARKFLGGQLSQDVLALRADRVELAGLHNPQGRVLTLLHLVPSGPEDVLCVLPRALLASTLVGLRKFLLRSKATLADESARWQLEGLADDAAAVPLGTATGSACTVGDTLLWRHAADGRVLRLRPSGESPATAESQHPAASSKAWQLADIAAGLPQLTPATQGEFVAQMLNLDALGGICFTKGCYTGQEVIARAHYRGRVKRRAQRFRLVEGPLPLPGESIDLDVREGDADRGSTTVRRHAQVVNAAIGAQGIECLAVTTFDAGETAAAPPARAALQLPMSYPLPD